MPVQVIMQKINMLGISLTDHTCRESLAETEVFLHNGAMNTILYVSVEMLTNAAKDPKQKEWIEGMDLTVWSDSDIVHAAGVTSRNRVREVESREYLRELLRRLGRSEAKVLLLTDTEAVMEKLTAELAENRPDLNIAGEIVLPQEGDIMSVMINQINDVAPAVILSQMTDAALQEQLMTESRKYVNSELWLALSSHMFPEQKKHFFTGGVMKKLYRRYFSKAVSKYREKEEKDSGDSV